MPFLSEQIGKATTEYVKSQLDRIYHLVRSAAEQINSECLRCLCAQLELTEIKNLVHLKP